MSIKLMDFLRYRIEQKTTSKALVPPVQLLKYMTSLLYARAADAYSYNTGEKMVSYSDEQIKTC
jgi:excinuclease ABC subunit A